jgi:hypothetical protein
MLHLSVTSIHEPALSVCDQGNRYSPFRTGFMSPSLFDSMTGERTSASAPREKSVCHSCSTDSKGTGGYLCFRHISPKVRPCLRRTFAPRSFAAICSAVHSLPLIAPPSTRNPIHKTDQYSWVRSGNTVEQEMAGIRTTPSTRRAFIGPPTRHAKNQKNGPAPAYEIDSEGMRARSLGGV